MDTIDYENLAFQYRNIYVCGGNLCNLKILQLQ